VIGDKREVVVTFAKTDVIDPENEEIPKAAGIELLAQRLVHRSFLGVRQATLSRLVKRFHAWSESLCTVILAHARATKCSKSLVKRDSPTGRAKGTALRDHTVGWTPKAPQLTQEPRLVSPDVRDVLHRESSVLVS